jgi:exportin-T
MCADTDLRNKLAYDLAHLFIDSYPATIPSFLHPFFPLLGSDHHDPVYLVIHLLNEIALEIHDSTMRSARPFSQTRFLRDGNIRDSIRSSGDEASAVQGMLQVAQRALDQGGKWLEVGDFAMKTLATWTRE